MKETIEVFEGRVNDKTFQDRASMQKYISYCIENGIDITNTATHTSYKEVNVNEDRDGQPCDGCRYTSITPFPKEYDTLEDYLVPFVVEDAFCDDVRVNKQILKDVEAKLKRRCEYFVENFGLRHNSTTKFQKWITKNLVNRLQYKSEWCNKRMGELTKSIENGDERIKRLQAEIAHIKENQSRACDIRECYDQVGGYCQATIENITSDDRYAG